VRTPRLSGDEGASSVEYGLVVTAIAAVVVVVVIAFGQNVTSLFTHTCDRVSEQVDKHTC
jgi:Flp pilus assembly pilin Flp